MPIERPRPPLCEEPTFNCPCNALIYNRIIGRWLCSYCTSKSYTPLNQCLVDMHPGRCVDKATGNWFCEQHGRQCDVLVPRPQGSGWPALNLPCSQIAFMHSQVGRYVCDDHLDDIVAARGNLTFRPQRSQAGFGVVRQDASLGADRLIHLDVISSVVERECPICMEPKARWRALKVCGHELCEDCLQGQLLSSLDNRFSCPFDRRSLFDAQADR